MTNAKKVAPVKRTVPVKDEFHGVGGSYVLDPKTGKRTLQQRTSAAADSKKED